MSKYLGDPVSRKDRLGHNPTHIENREENRFSGRNFVMVIEATVLDRKLKFSQKRKAVL